MVSSMQMFNPFLSHAELLAVLLPHEKMFYRPSRKNTFPFTGFTSAAFLFPQMSLCYDKAMEKVYTSVPFTTWLILISLCFSILHFLIYLFFILRWKKAVVPPFLFFFFFWGGEDFFFFCQSFVHVFYQKVWTAIGISPISPVSHISPVTFISCYLYSIPLLLVPVCNISSSLSAQLPSL